MGLWRVKCTQGSDLPVGRRGNRPKPDSAGKWVSEVDIISQVHRSRQKPGSPRVYFKASLFMDANYMLNLEGSLSSPHLDMSTFGRNQVTYVIELLAYFRLTVEVDCEILPSPTEGIGLASDQAMHPHVRNGEKEGE